MEKCEVCGFEGEFVNEEYVGYDLIFCPDCYNSRTESCNHERYGYAKYFVGNGFRVQKFCSNCFSLFGCAIKHSDVDTVNVKTIEKDKYDRWHNEQYEKFQKRFSKIKELHSLWQVAEYQRKHQEYLNSQVWKEKRQEVLNRDSYLCQACLKHRASEVHHLTYDHFGDEPLFDLISVCRQCHEKISTIDIKRKSLLA